MENRLTAVGVGIGGWRDGTKKKKGLMDADNSVVIAGTMGGGGSQEGGKGGYKGDKW